MMPVAMGQPLPRAAGQSRCTNQQHTMVGSTVSTGPSRSRTSLERGHQQVARAGLMRSSGCDWPVGRHPPVVGPPEPPCGGPGGTAGSGTGRCSGISGRSWRTSRRCVWRDETRVESSAIADGGPARPYPSTRSCCCGCPAGRRSRCSRADACITALMPAKCCYEQVDHDPRRS